MWKYTITDNLFSPNIFQKYLKEKKERGLWVQVLKNWYLDKLEKDPNIRVIINDVRFLHEYDIIKSLGGYIIKVNRNNALNDEHISENELDNTNFDCIIQNNSSIQDLYRKIKEIIN